MSVVAAVEREPYPSSDARQHWRRAVPRLKKYHTDEERREAARKRQRKYYNANRETLNARHTERDRKKRAAMKAERKET
jgi:hypothetical protein